MPCLINPGGRIVEIDNQLEYERWKNTDGFKVPSQELIDEHYRMRLEVIREMHENKEMEENHEKGLYFATVTQGGKDGYGVSGANVLKHMKRMGTNAKTYYDGQNVCILYHNPYSITRIESPYKMIYTMFESDKIPDDWLDYLRAANRVLVPSKWCQSIFKKSGIESEVVPLGYDDLTYKYIERPIKRETHGVFSFLHYNAFNIRKGFPEVFKAFTQEFHPSEPVKLVLKFNGDHPPLPILKDKYPNIEVITGAVEDNKMSEICGAADAFVFPSRGEGFGQTPLEAMATGLPTIVPNAHGITEYFDDRYMYEVKVKETCPALYSRYKGIDVGKMVVCDIDHLASQMRYIYEHEREAKHKGKQASVYVKAWTFEKTAAILKKLVDEVMEKPIPPSPQSNILTLEKVS